MSYEDEIAKIAPSSDRGEKDAQDYGISAGIWRQVRIGRPPIWDSPLDMWHEACKYFEWCTENPILEDDVKTDNGSLVHIVRHKPRIMNKWGLCTFLNVDYKTFKGYEKKTEFLPVIEQIESIIASQSYEGAAVGMFNANLVSRYMGLADNQNVQQDVTSSDGSMSPKGMTDEELAEALKKYGIE
ncbi:terminase small subunit [Yersinia phage PY100]|nr:terminase small subunit [Yersinia phage PY100]